MNKPTHRLAYWAIGILLLGGGYCLSPELFAAVQAKLAISAVVINTCRIEVQLVNTMPVVRNTCSLLHNAGSGATVETRFVGGNTISIVVVY